MKINLHEVYAYVICIFAVMFGLPYLGDLLYTILHMIFLADHSNWTAAVGKKYGETLVKVVPMIIVAAGAFYIHWKMAKKAGKSKK